MLRRLSASRLFALGDRAGALRSAQARCKRPFRLDVRQRVIVKALVSRHVGGGASRAVALAAHVSYLTRAGAGLEAGRPELFQAQAGVGGDGAEIARGWSADRHHFRFIISPEHADRIADLERFTRETMRRVTNDLGDPSLEWVAVCHYDTDQPHAHVLLRGRRASGRDLVISRHYISYGVRARAQEVAQELLGDLSRAEAERRVWRETQADRFTGFDRRLVQAADAHCEVEDGVGRDAWAALARGRLRHLESLGLAVRAGPGRYRLDQDLEPKLRALQSRRDVQRTLHQRRLEGGRVVRELQGGRVEGRLVKAGHYDELGGARWAIVRDASGIEHLARLRLGQAVPPLGRPVSLQQGDTGATIEALGRVRDLGR